MSVKWQGPLSLINPNMMPQGSSLVLLGARDNKEGFRVIGAVIAPSQESLVRDILEDGGINFQGGMSYEPFNIEGINESTRNTPP